MIICVDMDNILCNLQETVTKISNDVYGTSYSLNDFTHYDISECLNKNDALNMKKLYVKTGIYDCVNVINGAKNAIQRLKKSGHEIYIVTDSAPSMIEEKVNWIKYNFDIDHSHVISMKHKWLFKCDVMVEDNLDNLLGGYHYDRVLFDYPWNRDVHDEVYDIHRVQNWSEALDVINKLNKNGVM